MLDSHLSSFVGVVVPALQRWAECGVLEDELLAFGGVMHFLASYYDVSGSAGLAGSAGPRDPNAVSASSDLSPWTVPLSVMATNLPSKVKVASWLWRCLKPVLLSPLGLSKIVSFLSGPSAHSAADALHGICRLVLTTLQLLPGDGDVLSTLASCSAVLLQSVSTLLGSVEPLFPSDPILHIRVDEVSRTHVLAPHCPPHSFSALSHRHRWRITAPVSPAEPRSRCWTCALIACLRMSHLH